MVGIWWLVTAATGLLVLAGFATLLWLLVTSKQVPRRPRPAVLAGRGEWFAQPSIPRRGAETVLSRIGGWGRLRIADGWVSFVPDGAAQPQWILPAREVEVRIPGLSPEIGLRHPLIGEKVVRISLTKGSRWRSSDDTSALSDFAPARDVAAILRGWGAREF